MIGSVVDFKSVIIISMFGFLKKERDSDTSGYFHRLAQGLKKTRSGLFGGLKAVFTSGAGLNEAQLEEIESRLLMADLGIEATNQIMEGISSLRKSDKLQSEEDFMHCLYEQMSDMLKPVETPLIIDNSAGKPAVILVVGVNGVGKTTTIGKLSKHMQEQGRNVLLAAGDTFRAAAIDAAPASPTRLF